MNPLAPNLQGYSTDTSGNVTGLLMSVTPVAGAKYKLVKAQLIPEIDPATGLKHGQVTARCSVLDKNGYPTPVQVRMAWPGVGPFFENSAMPGSSSGEHVLGYVFHPPAVGLLAFYVGEHNKPESDILTGGGLANGHHTALIVVFQEIGVSDADARVQRLDDWAKKVSLTYPGGPQYVG